MIARWCRSIHFCQTRFDADGTTVWRSRRTGSDRLVDMANALMWAQRDSVRFLRREQWLDHEVRMYQLTDVPSVCRQGDALRLPRFEGSSLESIIACADEDCARHAFCVALQSLRQLHNTGETHGDAHAANVLVDAPRSAARWIDFETQHLPIFSPSTRQADDLAVLIASALSLWRAAPSDLARVLASTLEEKTRFAVAQRMRRRRWSLFARAQADLRRSERSRFADLLVGRRR